MIVDRLAERKADKHNIIYQDELRLKKIRETINKSLKEKNKQHVFDSQKDLPQISNKVDLAKYRKDLKEQQLGMSEINSFLETEISKDKPLKLDKLRAYFEEQIKKYKLAPWQIERYKMVFDEISNNVYIIDEFWNKNKNKPAAELESLAPRRSFCPRRGHGATMGRR